MTARNRRRIKLSIIAAIMMLSVLSSVSRNDTYAANVNMLEEIRVALFIQGRDTVPSVTVSSASPLAIGLRQTSGVQDWATAPSGKPVRFSQNSYSLRVIETADYSAALNAYLAVASAGQAEFFAVGTLASPVYQVRLAGFRNAEEANSARVKIPGQYKPVVSGPLYAGVGSFATLEEAESRQAALAQSGVVSYVSIHPNAEGKIVYSVWIGESATAAELEQAKADAAVKAAGLTYQSIDSSLPYLLKRITAPLQAGGAEGILYYQFNEQNQNVWISAGESEIKVAERFGRSYRGKLELTTYGGKLAVINQLPFEHYLYAVVSSELGSAWPAEALKAQAVAARTYALKQGMKYKIAHISDTTYDQAYKGKGAEFAQAIAAVDATKSEVLVDKDGLIVPFYSSNTGGKTADSSEAWGNPVGYVKSVPSPDEEAQKGKPLWYRIMLPDGKSAYISSDYARLSDQKNAAGLPYVEVAGDNINIRLAPYVDNTTNAAVTQASTGQRFVWIGQEIESNAYNWIRGPFTAEQLKSTINARSSVKVQDSLKSLKVTKRGPSERVLELEANGQPVVLANPDSIRGALNGLPSTRFEIEETGRFTLLGAAGQKREFPETSGQMAVLSANGSENLALKEFYVMNSKGDVRAATTEAAFRFSGLGFGHGVGMSQYGVKAFAELGYDYQKILQYYYDGVSIVKE